MFIYEKSSRSMTDESGQHPIQVARLAAVEKLNGSLIENKFMGEKTVIAMYTCKDNLTPLLYSGKIKKKKNRG